MVVECLNCGERRTAKPGSHRILSTDACGRCGYVGWAPAAELDEATRRLLRERPPRRRRLLIVA